MRTLPDYLPKESRLVIVGCNPSLVAALTGFYYSGRGNQFWSLLCDSGLVPGRLRPVDTERVTEFGIGLTDLVKRPTKGSDGVSKREFGRGRDVLMRKLETLSCPRVIVFNGKIVYEQFKGRKCDYGLQKERLYGAAVYVLPSTSRRCARTSYRQKLRHFRRVFRLVRIKNQAGERPQSKVKGLAAEFQASEPCPSRSFPGSRESLFAVPFSSKRRKHSCLSS